MSNQVFAHDGNCVFTGVWTAITAAKSFDSLLLSPPSNATHFIRYTTGATAALSTGEVLTGGTGGATAVLVAQAVEVGTAGSSDTGIVFVKTVSGAFEAETVTGGTSTGTVDIIQDLVKLEKGIVHPKALLIAIEDAAVLMTINGTLPAVTQDYGIYVSAGQSRVIRGVQNIRNFKVISAVGSNGAVLKYDLLF